MKAQQSIALIAVVASLVFATAAYGLPVVGPNGNYYEFFAEPITFPEARAAAAAGFFEGAVGHLVTIVDQAEQDFVSALAGEQMAWIAASDEETEGTWKWVEGPETGTIFWQEGTTTTGTITYAGWSLNEPNNYWIAGRDEDACLINWFRINDGRWNDLAGDNFEYLGHSLGYVVEYEAVPEPATIALFATALSGLIARRLRRRRTVG